MTEAEKERAVREIIQGLIEGVSFMTVIEYLDMEGFRDPDDDLADDLMDMVLAYGETLP